MMKVRMTLAVLHPKTMSMKRMVVKREVRDFLPLYPHHHRIQTLLKLIRLVTSDVILTSETVTTDIIIQIRLIKIFIIPRLG